MVELLVLHISNVQGSNLGLETGYFKVVMDFLSPRRTMPGRYFKYITATSVHVVIRNHSSTIRPQS
jgi:hypothetical protein